MHERQIQTPLGPTLEFVYQLSVLAPVFFPFGFPEADLFGECGDGGDVDGGGGGGGEEGTEAVVEVGEEEDFTLGEGFEEGRLVYAVEGAGFDFAYAIMRINVN